MKMHDKELWNEIVQMFNVSKSNIIQVPGEKAIGEDVVKLLGLNEKTTLATIIYNVAGIVIGNCIRILGQGSSELVSIAEINRIEDGIPTKIKGLLIVATDIFGGMYAMNTEEIDGVVGEIFYFGPDTLEWENLNMKYSQFLYWTVNGNTKEFYESMKWSDWETCAKETSFNQGILIYPFLWSQEIKIETASKKIVPFEELINVNMEYRGKFFN